jgi:hypothetical protein
MIRHLTGETSMLKPALIVAALLAVSSPPVWAARDATGLDVALAPVPGNPPAPQMGDRIAFASDIRNTGAVPSDGMVAWISLVRMDKGREAPVDLEDWSALKAVALPRLAPGEVVRSEWPMRLIASGHYRAVVSVAAPTGADLVTSPFADVAVREKPVVESARVLPVAAMMPGLFLGLLAWRRWRA